MREYIEYEGVITNEKNEVVHRFEAIVVRKTPPDVEKPSEVVCYCDINEVIGHVVASNVPGVIKYGSRVNIGASF